ncbi:LPS-assembly lipoprotein [Paraperlucidibaca baekdonensis]|uniref:LPS-assembly lipoprotein LptE n=1 Tax=Paraperlucidibaca baekdonensis TaxID=748120 RepID=A0A3E0H9Z9_9GAMM|nr:LPS assembly lipoprotein LptE [Paraperlucidibaca baekdonensis]REH40474.1 LPS-assembly lipoprotein [Paraperlucidibaca baekdonensis]
MPRLAQIAVVAFIALGLSACGFALRGSYTLPGVLNPIAVIGDDSATRKDLSASIIRAGGVISDAAPLRLHLTAERITRQTTSIDSRAKAAEYTLFFELEYQLRYPSGLPATPERIIRLRRTYQFDNTRIVGKFEEENTLIDDLRQQAVAQIMTQLTRLNADDLTPELDTPTDAPSAAPSTRSAADATPR